MGRVVVVVGLDRAKVRTVTLGKSTRAIQTDIIRVMFSCFHHNPRSVPSQGVVAMLTLDEDTLTHRERRQGEGVLLSPF